MSDPRERFRAADGIPAPDLWPEIERRIPRALPSRPAPARILASAVALLIAAAGIFFAVRAFHGSAPQPVGPPIHVKANGRIAFVVPGSNAGGLRSVDPTGAGGLALASGLTHVAEPAWSPQGNLIAFVARRGPEGGIWLVGSPAAGITQLTREAGDAGPAWSPDGRQVAFVRGGPVNGSIMVVNTDGTGLRQLCSAARCGNGVAQLAWSPDGRLIAFSHAGAVIGPPVDQVGQIDVIGVDGSDLRAVTKCTQFCTIDVGPSWSPDGAHLVFNHGAGSHHGQKIQVTGFTERRPKLYARCPIPWCRQMVWPAWSPDARSIAFPQVKKPGGGPPSIQVVDARTRAARALLTCDGSTCVYPLDAVWSPDGTQIVFTAGPKLGPGGAVSPDGLYVIDVAGGPPRKIAGGEGICCPSWQPVP